MDADARHTTENAADLDGHPGPESGRVDPADRAFWGRFRDDFPAVDILIDDGGHNPEQQMVTLEETLLHLRPGGVFLCEDVHGVGNGFAAFALALADNLNAFDGVPTEQRVHEFECRSTNFQRAVYSVHLYPFVVVIERTEADPEPLVAPKHVTEWQPFL